MDYACMEQKYIILHACVLHWVPRVHFRFVLFLTSANTILVIQKRLQSAWARKLNLLICVQTYTHNKLAHVYIGVYKIPYMLRTCKYSGDWPLHTVCIDHNHSLSSNVQDHICGSHSLWRKMYTGSASYWFVATTTFSGRIWPVRCRTAWRESARSCC